MGLMLRRRLADLTHSYEPSRVRPTGRVSDPMAAAKRRRIADAKAARVRGKAERRKAIRERDPSLREPGWRLARKLGDRGIAGPGGGAMQVVTPPREFQAITSYACGLFPFVHGDSYPMIGTPLGEDSDTKGLFCYDPISATYVARRQVTPSVFILGLPSFGKSTVGRKWFTGAVAQGQIPIVFADTKPDFAVVTEALGGMVVKLGHGEGHLNPLAVGALGSIIPLLGDFPEVQRKVIKQVRQRRRRLMLGLCEIERGDKLTQTEKNLLTKALALLEDDTRFGPHTPPLIKDLVELIESAPPELMRKAHARDEQRYQDKSDSLLEILEALLDGELGEVFSEQTSTPLDLSGPRPPVAVCVDISGLDVGDDKLEAAVMLACWEDGFGAVEAAHILADCGLRPPRQFVAILDEFWRVLSSGPGMVSRIDALTRLTRTLGTALVMITHTVKDLESLEADFDILKAKGFIERAGAVVVGALPRGEMDKLDAIIPFTSADRDYISGLATPGGYDPILGRERPSPGRGKFLLKQGTERVPGHRFDTVLTAVEAGWHDTDTRMTTADDDTNGDGDGAEGQVAA